MTNVTIELLGGFAAAVDGKPVPAAAWRLKKARELVKLLALAPGRRLHREQAMDIFWRDRDPASAANNLHQAVYVARRALGADAIIVRDELLTLYADVDVDAFEHAGTDACRVGTVAACRAALTLYGGELLPENRYDDWAAARREELAELHDVLASRLAQLEANGPLQGLPAEASSFVGRARELRKLRALLRQTRMLTLTGVGGAGKTRLALELARRAQDSYRDGAVLVELATVADPDLVLETVAAALEVRALSGGTLADAVAGFLSSRSALIVLDNCEHVLSGSAPLVDHLLRAAPELTIVATSREPLHVPAEVVFQVPSLALPNPDKDLAPSALRRYEAARLFVERAAAASPGFSLDRENAADVARICLRLDGLPLALELAASHVRALGPATIASRLGDRFTLLRTHSNVAPSRQQTLEATLHWSHELLTEEERVVFRRLASFAGSFDLSATEAVCAGEGVLQSDVADLLAQLVEKSLVSVDGSGRERRYRLLETVRLYARERLEEAGEAHAWARRQATWALKRAEEEQGSKRMDADAPNFRRALDVLLDSDPKEALRLCIALRPFWLRRIDLDEARRRLDAALRAIPERTSLRAEALLAAGSFEMRAARLDRVRTLATEGFAIAEEVDNLRQRWHALLALSGAAIASDDPEAAISACEHALRLARDKDSNAAEAVFTCTLGVAQWMFRDRERAEELVSESIDAFRALQGTSETVPAPLTVSETRSSPTRIIFEDTLHPFREVTCRSATGYALANLAVMVRERGDLEHANDLLKESSRCFADDDAERGQADVLVRIGYHALAAGSSIDARDNLERALKLRRRLNERRGIGMALTALSLVETGAGNFDQAEEHLTEARDLFVRAEDRWGLIWVLWNTAELARARDEPDRAGAALEEARIVLVQAGRPRWLACTLADLAETALTQGDRGRGQALLREARELFAGSDDDVGVAHVEDRLKDIARQPRTA